MLALKVSVDVYGPNIKVYADLSRKIEQSHIFIRNAEIVLDRRFKIPILRHGNKNLTTHRPRAYCEVSGVQYSQARCPHRAARLG